MDLKNIRSGERQMNGSEIRDEAEERVRSEAKKARHEAETQGEVLRHRLGESMLDLMEDYFPEEVEARRRENLLRGFAVGVVTGILGRELLRRW